MPPIGITMGCPVSIGPEIILKYFAESNRHHYLSAIVIGDIGVLEKSAEECGIAVQFRSWLPGEPVPEEDVGVYQASSLDTGKLHWGMPTRETGSAMAGYIETAARLAGSGDLDGIVTCPISKSALHKAGYNYPGHTEMLAGLTGASRFTMMMAGKTLRITLVTIHCRLADIPSRLTTQAVAERIRITSESLRRDFGIASPRIGVAGLNPHGGEEGLFGEEEANIISPAVQQVREEGINAAGPFPPDTVFVKAAAGAFDAVVCMYHDQGLIPFKLLHFSDGVNVTIGLPIVRTSVDHGTAYDIAGKGLADAASLTEAVALAGLIAENRKIWNDGR